MTRLLIVLLILVGAGLAPAAAQGWDPRDAADVSGYEKLIRRSNEGVEAFLEKDPSLEAFFNEAYGFVIFPRVGKGGIGIGYARGRGVVYRNQTPQAKAYLTQYSLGAQLGGRSYAEIIFFRDQFEYDEFLNGDFSFRADAAAVISTDGAGAATDYSNGVAVFTRERGGAMVDASLGGQRFKVEAFEE
ncbi:MAG: lipid-binding SYLF domain-containing protein [Pseudomonadota bacterium]